MTLCYEYLDEIWRGAPKQPGPAGITPRRCRRWAVFLRCCPRVWARNVRCAQVPSFGSAEDAADQFSTFMMLRLGKDDARRLISGAAYSYRNAVQDSASFVALQAFSDMHSMPAQHFSTCCVSPMGLIRPRSRMLSRKNTSPRVALVTASARLQRSHICLQKPDRPASRPGLCEAGIAARLAAARKPKAPGQVTRRRAASSYRGLFQPRPAIKST